MRTCVRRRLVSATGAALLAFALALLPTVAKRSGTTGVSPVGETSGVPLPRNAESLRGSGVPAVSVSGFWLSQIEPSSNSVALGVAWLPGAFAAPPFVEFFVNTNLAIDAWTLLGWAEAEVGETNLCVDVETSRLPGGMMPPAAFFRATAYDGIGAADEDDDGDGLPNGWENSHGTNPLRVDTDGDGIADGEEAARVTYGATLPDFDLSSLPDAFAGTMQYAVFPDHTTAALPFDVDLGTGRSTNIVVHFAGVAEFLAKGAQPPSGMSAFHPPANLYASGNAAVAAYGLQFLMMGYTGAQLRAGVIPGTQGRWFVAEWHGMMDLMGYANFTFERATFQIAVSENDPGTVHVRYLALADCFDGSDAIIGAHGFGGTPDLLVSDGDSGVVASGMTISYHFGTGTDPLNPDSDGDGLPDGWEAAHGMNPLASNAGDLRTDASADPDLDGLANAQEATLGTDPFQPDTDGDGMDDGWEAHHGFDPCTHNSQTERTDDNASADADGDGLTNAEECAWGTNPSGADANGDGIPDGRDTDGDGVTDGAEIAQDSDPADATDEGKPGSRTPVSFYFGDHSTSCSEKYRLTVSPVPVAGEANLPRTFSWVNARYDQCETRTAMLTPGCSYEVRLAHASTKRPQGPDYDYTLNAVDVPQSVMVSDPDGLLGVHLSDSTFTGAGRTAVVTAYKVEVAVCSPDDDDWPELDASRVVLDDEELRIKVTVSPQMSSLAAVRQKFGDSLTVNTSGTCPQGVSMPMGDEALFVNTPGKSEIRMVKTRQQLVSLGLLPSQNEDGVNEMAWVDVPEKSGQDLSDSTAFSALGYAFRGKAIVTSAPNLEASPPISQRSTSFLKSAGCEVISVTYGSISSDKRQIMNQADYLYFSGHGDHYNNSIQGGFKPSDAADYWKKDLDVAIIAGCSVLDINDYNGNYDGTAEHAFSPGKAWEQAGPGVLLGYAYIAPGDAGGAPARIMNSWVSNRGTLGDVNAWMKANADNNAWNACAIVKDQKFVYFTRKWFSRVIVEKQKGEW